MDETNNTKTGSNLENDSGTTSIETITPQKGKELLNCTSCWQTITEF